MGYTLSEKILLAHADADDVEPGQIVMVRCDLVFANDVSGPVAFRAMEKMGATEVFDPAKIVMVADHFAPAKDERSAILQQRLKEWSKRFGVTFYDQGRGGIEHAVLVEDGWVTPGSVIAGGDSHTCTHGALGAFATGLGSTDIAHCLVFGTFWQAVPGTIQVEVTGTKGRYVSGKDVILAVLAQIGAGGGTNMALEFVGPGAEGLSIDERLAVANMAVEAGSETGIFPADEKTAEYLEGRTDTAWTAERSDPDAEIAQTLHIDFDTLEPLIAMPHNPENVQPLSEVVGTPIHQVYVGNCSNGTLTDLRQTAAAPARRQGARDTRDDRRPRDAEDTGAPRSRRGCSTRSSRPARPSRRPRAAPASAADTGVLGPNENALTTTNRNFKGRMGSGEAGVHLANAYVATAAAIAGEIVDPAEISVAVPA